MAFDRVAHCQRIAASGGKATVARLGREHMKDIGREGGYAILANYGVSYLKQLGSAGKAACIAKHGQDKWQYVSSKEQSNGCEF